MTTAAIVLAAGGGARFVGATHKLLATLPDGMTIVERVVASATAAMVDRFDAGLPSAPTMAIDALFVVVGAIELPALPDDVTVVENPRWAEGQATSLQAGIAAAAGHDAVVVGLGDQPGVTPEAWRLVAAATATPIAVATYDGQRANPVRLAAEVWPLLPTEGDEGARSLLRGRPDLVTEVPCPGSGADVDTLEDLERWSS